MDRHSRALPLALALIFAARAEATTIIPIADRTLVDRSPLVVVARVESKSAIVADRPATDWTVVVERVLKGTVNASRIVVRMPGGPAPDGMVLHIYGAPPLAAGRRGIFFLVPSSTGDFFQLVDFPQGAFVGVRTRLRTLAFRDFSQVRVLGDSRTGSRRDLRDFDRFSDWIADRAAGTLREVDYMAQPRRSELRNIRNNYTLKVDHGLFMRWFAFDSGRTVVFRSAGTAPAGIANGGAGEIQRALAAWTNEKTTPILLAYGGAGAPTTGFKNDDGSNTILWGDPNNDMPGPFDCASGGTLAQGGPWTSPSVTSTFDNRVYEVIQEADLVMNDGIECRLSYSPNFGKFIEEVLAHELGHTLGLSHSSENPNETSSILRDALMYYRAHDDGRGAQLTSDDIGGIQALYTRGHSTPPPPPGTCPAGTLCLQNGRFQATLTWTNQFNGVSGVGKPIASTNYAGYFYFDQDPTNIELILKILDYDGKIVLSYSQLTVINFRLHVVDTLTGKAKDYANTAGNCGALDPDYANTTAAQLTAGGPPATVRDLGVTEAPSAGCVASASTLCLLGKRFKATLPAWRNQFNGATGAGSAKPLSNLTGAFHFSPDPSDLDTFLKLNQFPDKILVFWGTLNSLEYTMRLTDTRTGRTMEVANPANTFCGGLNQSIFVP